jgi:murein L,D-transpeptidase YafK
MLKLLLFLTLASVLIAIAIWMHRNARPLAVEIKADRILVEKGARSLTLFRGATPLKVYRVALGSVSVGPKQFEGDHRTPEGSYTIDRRKADSDFHLALHISYPNPDDVAQAATRGVPAGSDIMIHGLPNGSGWIGALHRRRDWTDGCIAVTDQEIEEIWRAVPDGTTIEIRP